MLNRDNWAVFDEAKGKFSTYATREKAEEYIGNIECHNGDVYLLKIDCVNYFTA